LNPDQVAQKAVQYLESMTEQWYAGEAPTIGYEDPLCRWPYMFVHAAVQANLFYRVLIEAGRRSESLRRKLIHEESSLVVFGGGPETELLGIAKYYLDRAEGGKHAQVEIRIDSIDRVSEWIENVSWIKAEIAKAYTEKFGKRLTGPPSSNVYPYSLDFSDVDGFGNLPSLFRSDIFVLNYVVSEVVDLDELLPIMKKMVEGCARGAHFLFVDRSDSETRRKIETLIEKLDLEIECRDKTEGEETGLTDEEVAFYDALAENESARQVMGEPTLRVIATELVASIKSSVSVDWMHREAARARIRVLVKRLLHKYGYPPDLQDAAVQKVLQQAEALSAEWAA
jgi:hypothetical protein